MSDGPSSALSYAVTELADHYNDRRWWRDRVHQRVNGPVQREIRPRADGIDVLGAEWDTLVVLDACRADLFDDVVGDFNLGFDERMTVTSRASATPEWLAHTFGASHGDIVYVAGNPMVTRHRPNAFHQLVEVWRDAYDEETSIVDPGAVTKAALDAREANPHKRLVIHYMQPHYPFVDRPDLNYAEYHFEDIGLGSARDGRSANDIWDALRQGLVASDVVWEGYAHTLSVALAEVEQLLDTFDDRVVVTSDHGNALGERTWPVPIRAFGHPQNQRLDPLIHVPWAVRYGKRRRVTDDGVSSASEAAGEEVRSRLSNLGYVDG